MLAVDVWPALVTAYSALIDVAPTAAMSGTLTPVALRGLSEGEQESIPESPWAWLLNDTGDAPAQIGSDKALTKLTFKLRLMVDWTNDPTQAERILMPLLEQVRQVHQFHLKLQTQTVVFSKVVHWDWGYTPVNGIWYRNLDLTIAVDEKEIRNVQA